MRNQSTLSQRPFEPPRLVGHRGAAALAPENTLASIRAAHKASVRWVEVDAKLAQDGVPVLMHDSKLDRTTNATGWVAYHTSEELSKLDAGYWFGVDRTKGETGPGPQAGQPVPTLRECLDLVRELGLGLDLEIKPDRRTEASTAAACLEVLDEAGWTEHDPIIFTSFRTESLRVIRDFAPGYHRGLLIWEFPDGWQDHAHDLGVVTVISDEKSLKSENHVREISGLNYPVMCYTVNDPQRAAELYSWGVSGIVTDDPVGLAGV